MTTTNIFNLLIQYHTVTGSAPSVLFMSKSDFKSYFLGTGSLYQTDIQAALGVVIAESKCNKTYLL